MNAKDFHEKCDSTEATLTIIQSGSNIFGGYTPLSWRYTGDFKKDPTIFLFTITNPFNIPPSQFYVKRLNDDGMNCGHRDKVPCFRTDLWINDSTLGKSDSYFPDHYANTTGNNQFSFTGSKYFTVDKIEVYAVVPEKK